MCPPTCTFRTHARYPFRFACKRETRRTAARTRRCTEAHPWDRVERLYETWHTASTPHGESVIFLWHHRCLRYDVIIAYVECYIWSVWKILRVIWGYNRSWKLLWWHRFFVFGSDIIWQPYCFVFFFKPSKIFFSEMAEHPKKTGPTKFWIKLVIFIFFFFFYFFRM